MLKISRKTLRSETGAVLLLEVALLVAVLGLASFAVYRGYKARHTANQPSKPVPHQSKQSQSADGTANWNTYTSAKEGLSFRYPNDWTVEGKPTTGAQQVPSTIEHVVLKGSNGFRLELAVGTVPLDGHCGPEHQKLGEVTAKGSPVLIEVDKRDGRSSVTYLSDEPGCFTVYKSKTLGQVQVPGLDGAYSHYVSFRGYYSTGKYDTWRNVDDASKSFTTAAFIDMPEVKTTQRVYQTIKY
jgi:PsbP-like protein